MQAGFSYKQAINAVRNANSSGGIGLHTETGKRLVLVGFARNGAHSCVIEIDRNEYANLGGLKILKAMEE